VDPATLPLAAATAGTSPAAVLSLVLSVGTIVFVPLVTWLVARRKTSGSTHTSEAAELWAESKAMRDTLTARLEKAEEQRDRAMEGLAGQVLPVMAAVNETLRELSASITIVVGAEEAARERDRRIMDLLNRLLEDRDG
jgi:hypothetical protein